MQRTEPKVWLHLNLLDPRSGNIIETHGFVQTLPPELDPRMILTFHWNEGW